MRAEVMSTEIGDLWTPEDSVRACNRWLHGECPCCGMDLKNFTKIRPNASSYSSLGGSPVTTPMSPDL